MAFRISKENSHIFVIADVVYLLKEDVFMKSSDAIKYLSYQLIHIRKKSDFLFKFSNFTFSNFPVLVIISYSKKAERKYLNFSLDLNTIDIYRYIYIYCYKIATFSRFHDCPDKIFYY